MTEALFPSPDHDHTVCIESAVTRAKLVCQSNGIKFTSLRERVFRVIAAQHKAIGAYEIIEVLSGDGRRVAPISMYRILDALSEVGLIHRLESKNAYFACHGERAEGVSACCSQVFLICQQCDMVIEAEGAELEEAVKNTAASAKFKFQNALLEIVGICEHCG